MEKRLTVVLDFDGVVHSYTSGWKGLTEIPDLPVLGIRTAIEEIRKEYRVVIVSSRTANMTGRQAVVNWLEKYGIEVDDVCCEKPPAIVYIDDRAICFDGNPDKLLGKIKGFTTWMQKITKPGLDKDVVLGGIYKNFKGTEYVVLCTSEDSETEETLVTYKDDEGKKYTRKLSMFLESVLIHEMWIPRFTYTGVVLRGKGKELYYDSAK